jgi:hypothetical protein
LWAEAANRTGDDITALLHLNNELASQGLPAVAGLTGAALFQEIMTEKYIALFQNIEVWSDYKRTCIPALTPAGGAAQIPGRLLYSQDERNANPNIPAPGATASASNYTAAPPNGFLQTNSLGRNWDDPNPCP